MSRDYVKMKASHRIGIALVACLLRRLLKSILRHNKKLS